MRHFIHISEDIGPSFCPSAQGDGTAVITVLQTFHSGDTHTLGALQSSDAVEKCLPRSTCVGWDVLTCHAFNANEQFRTRLALGISVQIVGPIVVERGSDGGMVPLPGHNPVTGTPRPVSSTSCWQVSRLADFGRHALRRLILPDNCQWL